MKKLLSLFCILMLLAGCSSVGLQDVSKHMDMLTTTASAAQKASRPITDEEEYYIGRAVAARILSSFSLSKNRKLSEYVNHVGLSISLHSEKPHTHGGYHFAILESTEMNAFACPGGTIFVTKGMVNAAKSEDELAAVLAHEIAHVNHRDGISAIKKSRWTEALTIIGTKAAREYGSQGLSQLTTIFEGSIDDIVKTLVVNGYGRSQEYDADKTALDYLSKAGYDPSALKAFLDRIIAGGKASEGGIMKTHPATTDRIGNVMENMPSTGADSSYVRKRTDRFISFLR
ncbi:MAG: M48 family metalloprotease [Nitrospirae bacterium]|nr:M48 family metalloprotease [Nitrospirota bacterium]